MDRRVTPTKRVTSPTWGPPPLCKQALSWLCCILAGMSGGRQQTMLLLQVDKRLELASLFVIQHPPAILCKLRRSYATVFFKHNFHQKGKEASIKTRSTPASYSLKGQDTKHNCKMVNSPSVKYADVPLASHAGVFRGILFPPTPPLKTPAWKAFLQTFPENGRVE